MADSEGSKFVELLNFGWGEGATAARRRGHRGDFWFSTPGRPALTCSEELQSIRANTCSRAAKNSCQPTLAP